MTQVTQEFSVLLLRKEKTRPRLEKPETPHNTRRFQPYKARDKPVSDAVQKVREHVSKAHKAMLRQGKAKCGGEVHSQNCGRCGSAAVTSHEGKTAVEGQLKLGRNASRIKAVCRTSPATAKIPRQAMAFRGSKCVTVFEVGYGVYAKGRETTAAAIAFREYEKCYQRANSLILDSRTF